MFITWLACLIYSFEQTYFTNLKWGGHFECWSVFCVRSFCVLLPFIPIFCVHTHTHTQLCFGPSTPYSARFSSRQPNALIVFLAFLSLCAPVLTKFFVLCQTLRSVCVWRKNRRRRRRSVRVWFILSFDLNPLWLSNGACSFEIVYKNVIREWSMTRTQHDWLSLLKLTTLPRRAVHVGWSLRKKQKSILGHWSNENSDASAFGQFFLIFLAWTVHLIRCNRTKKIYIHYFLYFFCLVHIA